MVAARLRLSLCRKRIPSHERTQIVRTQRFLVAYVIISAICVLVGLTLQALPPFWGGLFCGVGIGFLGALMLLHKNPRIDITKFPQPSASVQSRCNDPDCDFPSRSFAEAVKAYCDETGAT
jgi:hypothetical protein